MILIDKKGQTSAIVFLIFGLSLMSGCIDSTENNSGDDFEFTLLDGTTKNLSDYRGKIVILDMWATWCGPCVYQMVELKKAYENYSRDELEILSIDIDQRETSLLIQSFINNFKESYGIELNWIFGLDDGKIWEKYKIGDGIPTLCLFDKNGKLSFAHEGVISFLEEEWSQESLKIKIDELLK